MTDESLNLDISKLIYSDHRPTNQRRHSRQRGWRPPDTRNVNITDESYDIIRSLALARGQRHSPFYEEVSQFIIEYQKVREELDEKQEFLDAAIEDKRQLRLELEKVKLDISKLNVCIVSLGVGFY